MKENKAFSFLTIGKTQESTENQGFKRYVGLGSSYVLAVNPTKEQLDKIRGYESQREPEYVRDSENGKEAHIHFIVKTDPETNNGIEIFSTLMFTLRQTPAYNRDETRVQVIDAYGNSTWANVEDAKAGKKLLSSEGRELKIDTQYRMACVGEADLVAFLKKYLCVGEAFEYKNGSWIKKADANQCLFKLEHVKDFFNGNVQELREALALQPNNKVKLLYGVKTNEDGRQYQVVASRESLILSNNASMTAINKADENLRKIKDNGGYPTTEFKVQELAEYDVAPTNFSNSQNESVDFADTSSELPWD